MSETPSKTGGKAAVEADAWRARFRPVGRMGVGTVREPSRRSGRLPPHRRPQEQVHRQGRQGEGTRLDDDAAPAVAGGLEFLTKELLTRHFRATGPEHVVGGHTTSTTNTSIYGPSRSIGMARPAPTPPSTGRPPSAGTSA